MKLRDFFVQVATTYRREEGLQTPAQNLLKRAATELADYAPGGFRIIGSGGKGLATYTPWVGFFNPDETTDPQEGVYVVFIFSEDLATLTLTLNQGMEHLRKQLGDKAARARLASDAAVLRAQLPAAELSGFDAAVDLKSKGARQRAYEAGNIAAVRYLLPGLPTEAKLEGELAKLLALYDRAIAAKKTLLLTQPGTIGSPSGEDVSPATDPLAGFKPKDDSDYVATLQGRELRKSRRHERLVSDYARWAAGTGYQAATEHPADLVLRGAGVEWLVEAKVVRLGNATEACRAALGQLFAYRHFLYSDRTRLVALFTEDIGHAYIEFLLTCGVESVWPDKGRWVGTADAVANRLAEVQP